MPRVLAGVVPLLLVALAASARGQDATGSAASEAGGFASTYGITGMRELIDARTPEDFVLRFAGTSLHDRIGLGSPVLARGIDRWAEEVRVGASALSTIDLGLRAIPWEYQQVTTRPVGQRAREVHRRGPGDVDLAAKASLGLDPVWLAPYAIGHLAVGHPGIRRWNETELGGAFTLAVIDGHVSLHANLAYVQRERGRLAFRYRGGLATVVWASDELLVRLFAYAEGTELEGTPGTEVYAVGGVQIRVLRHFTLGAAGVARVHDGALRRPVRDDGTWGVRLDFGFNVTF